MNKSNVKEVLCKGTQCTVRFDVNMGTSGNNLSPIWYYVDNVILSNGKETDLKGYINAAFLPNCTPMYSL